MFVAGTRGRPRKFCPVCRPAVKNRPATARVLKPCGTMAAYTRHLKHGEKPCVLCAEACREQARRDFCSRCGARRGRRDSSAADIVCADCRRASPSETVRMGYGQEHRRLRVDLLAAYVPGVTLCGICRRPMRERDTRLIHLAHDDDDLSRSSYLGLTHARCNTSLAVRNRKDVENDAWLERSSESTTAVLGTLVNFYTS